MEPSVCRKRVVIVASLLFMFFFMVDSSGHRQKYMEQCNKSKKCDFTRFLRCERGKCVCFGTTLPGTKELYYDINERRCVASAGSNCSMTFFPFDEDPHIFHMRGSTTNHWRYGNSSVRCGENAFCDFDGVEHRCKCKKNFYDTVNGTCLPLKNHGDTCTLDKECDPDKFIKCINNTCQCDKDIRVYDDKYMKKCVVQAGTQCEALKNKDDGRQVDDCPVHSVCIDEICECTAGTQIHSDKTCQRGYGQECGPDQPCGDSLLSCRSKLCQCKFQLHMVYEEIQGECVSLTSGPCSINDTSVYALHCTKNAECVQRGAQAECKCMKDYLQTTTGECVKVYGSSCELDIECDRDPPLACVNAKCDCPDGLQIWNPLNRQCLGVIGTRCHLNSHVSQCIHDSTCMKYEEEPHGNIGRCVCDRGFQENVNRTCSHKE